MSTTLVERICPMCDVTSGMELDAEKVRRWVGGELVQDAFPELSAAERELLVSGICPTCWDAAFGDEESDDEQEETG